MILKKLEFIKKSDSKKPYNTGADPENFSRGGPTLGKKKPITQI